MILKRRLEADAPSIDLTPVIDMVFLLLIFFLVATTFQQTEREMQIALPEASSAEPISAQLREIVINVDERGQVMVSGSPMSLEALRSMIGEAVRANPRQKVTVRGDRRATYAAVAAVLDACKGAGVGEPYLDTVPAG